MLLLLFGSSAAGKTFAIDGLRGRVAHLAVHHFDEIGVPPGADTAWRHRANEQWVRRGARIPGGGSRPSARWTDAVRRASRGSLRASPEGDLSLLDRLRRRTRVARLQARGPEWFARTAGDLQDYLSWAAWMREHAADPSWRPDVIRHEATEDEMRWSRWSGWTAADPRWRVRAIDTSSLPVEQVAAALIEWIEEERGLVRTGAHLLAGQAAYDQCDE